MRKIIPILFLLLGTKSILNAQEIRTFNNFELSPAFSDNLHQYSISYGETIQKDAILPFRFSAGVRYSLNNLKKGEYSGVGKSTLPSITFDKNIWYSTFAVPISFNLLLKSFGIGAFQELASISGKKKFNDFTAHGENETLRTMRFSNVFGKKQNLTRGAFISYNFRDAFTLRLGVNQVNSTFVKTSQSKEIGYTRIGENLYSIALRLNFEK